MAEASTLTLTLIIEKGPKAGETLTYPPTSTVKIGRVATGNTIAIKDAGISSKHISIQFDTTLTKWTLSDPGSSNGTVLNAQTLKPHAPSPLQHGDCIKIGELTSIAVKIGVQSPVRQPPPRRNTRQQGKAEMVELGGKEVKEGVVEKRNLRSRAKKAVDSKSEVEALSSKRVLRSSKKEVDGVAIEVPKMTRGRKKKMMDQLPEGDELGERKPVDVAPVVVPVEGRRTRRGRKALEESLNNADGLLQVDEVNEASGNVKDGGVGENMETNDEENDVVEKVVSPQKDCEGEDVVKDAGPDDGKWMDLEKMTLSDFFDYLEVQLPKEIYDKSEKIIADIKEKARKSHEFRLQRNGNGKAKE